jgi:hypothetical protein
MNLLERTPTAAPFALGKGCAECAMNCNPLQERRFIL